MGYLGYIHYVYHRGGGGQMILRGDLNFFGKEQGGMSRFFITGRGGCQFFSLILVYNEKATVIVFFF